MYCNEDEVIGLNAGSGCATVVVLVAEDAAVALVTILSIMVT